MPLFEESLKVDVVIDGTGLVESLVSAALSVTNHSVLHLDSNEYYGGNDCSLTLSQLRSRQESSSSMMAIDEAILPNDRKFLIDTRLRLLLADSAAVETIIKAGLSEHISFLPVKAVKWFHNGVFESVPLSKAAIFQSSNLSLLEKRSLMKFLTSHFSGQSLSLQSAATVGHDRYHETPTEPSLNSPIHNPSSWSESLRASGLTDKLVSIVNHGLCLFESSTEATAASYSAGQARLLSFVKSVGKFQEGSALLYPIYGSAEIAQAFCRKSAVHGGIFALKCGVKSEADGVISTTTDDRVSGYLVRSSQGAQGVARIVVVLEADENACELLLMEMEGSICFIVRLGHESACVPAGYEILHFSTIGDMEILKKAADTVVAGRRELLRTEFKAGDSNLSPSLSPPILSPILSHQLLFSAVDLEIAGKIFASCAPGENWPL